MKRVYRDDGALDVIFEPNELDQYMIGAIVGGNYKDGFTVRVKGIVKDLTNMVFSPKIMKEKECRENSLGGRNE